MVKSVIERTQSVSGRRGLGARLDAAIVGTIQRRIDIGEAEHGGHLAIAARFEPAFAHEPGRVAQCAEQDVPER